MLKISYKKLIKIFGKLLIIFLFLTINYIIPSSSSANLQKYNLGSQDVLSIEIWNHPDLSREVTVSPRGTISFPLIGEINVEGFTSEQLQVIISLFLADGYLVNPQVTVTIKEYNSKKIYALGEIKRPGYYPYTKATKLVDLISMAEGLTNNAGKKAYILRAKKTMTEPLQFSGPRTKITGIKKLDMEKLTNNLTNAINTYLPPEKVLNHQIISINIDDFRGINLNLEIKNNDILYIPKAESLYVMGEINIPGMVKLEKELNVLQVISMAGGFTRKANTRKVKIIRTIDGEEREIRVKMDDSVLPNDIIKVPERFF